jgi:hypothetical protein
MLYGFTLLCRVIIQKKTPEKKTMFNKKQPSNQFSYTTNKVKMRYTPLCAAWNLNFLRTNTQPILFSFFTWILLRLHWQCTVYCSRLKPLISLHKKIWACVSFFSSFSIFSPETFKIRGFGFFFLIFINFCVELSGNPLQNCK